MYKLAFLLCFALVSCISLSAQNATVKGIITDTINKQYLENSTISLLRAKDSTLQSFTRSSSNGAFELQHVPAGKYVVFVTHPTYADYADWVTIADGETVNLGLIKIILKATLLQEVIVRQQIAAIKVKGDTTEFRADSFHVRAGGSVEELLKKLPGIQVDKDGKITAFGESVPKILVDGEEFFGDDPTVATKNIQAEAIASVQVYDKKSDQATFTGIDDGKKTKTINLKMKDDKKHGYFGKVDLAGGLQDRWNNSAMYNRFRSKQKISAFGIMSSTGKTGLDWDERGKYGSGDGGPEYNEDLGYFSWSDNQDELNNASFYGEGLPKSWSGGLNYSNKYHDDKQSLNGSYRYNKLSTEGSGSNFNQMITGQTVFTSRDSGATFSTKDRHTANGTFDWAIDSLTSIKVKANGFVGSNNSYRNNSSITTNEKGIVSNSQVRNASTKGDNQRIGSSLLLRRKFKKIGRTISLNLDQQYDASNTDGYLYSNVFTLGSGNTLTQNLVDQKKQYDNNTLAFSGKLTYTEPLAKKWFIQFNYAFRNTSNNAEKLTYNKDINGKYANLSDTFSNHYQFDVSSHSGGSSIRFNGKKLGLNFGSDMAFTHFNQQDLFTTVQTSRNYVNFFPRASINYKFNQAQGFNFSYTGRTQQPTINQIQPVRDNTNPLNIMIGNASLKQQFNHSIDFWGNSNKVVQERYLYLYGGGSIQQNAIVSNITINDTSGKTVSQYINADGNYNFYMGSGYNIKLKKWDMNLDFSPGLNGYRYNSFVNMIKNTVVNFAPSLRLGAYKRKEKKYEISYNVSTNYNFSKTVVTSTTETRYWTMEHNFNVNLQLPLRTEINSDLNVNIREKTAQFTRNNNVYLWNAYIGKKLFKNDKGMVKLIAHDILNQNIGYSRDVTSNQISERNYQTITRYFLLSFVWNFSFNPATGNK